MRTQSLFLALPLLLTACGGGSSDPATLIDEGETALASGDEAGAVEKFEAALEGLDSSADGYLEAKLGSIRAAASVSPEKAKNDFVALVKEKGDEIGAKEYHDVIERLSNGGDDGIKAATDLLADAQAKFPDSGKLESMVKTLGDKAAASGSDALEALKGLGYVGD